MKHLTWDYFGYDDLKLDLGRDVLQDDWNATIVTKMGMAIDDDDYNIFCSEQIFDIFRTILGFDEETKTLFGQKVIVLLFDTPKIYITRKSLCDFAMLEHDNHASVTVKNYGHW